jgi:hypothetical protein
MLKFLRKYNKWILAVGGSLLMVVFLLPQALQQWGTGGANRVVAAFEGGEITSQDRFDANRDVRFLEAFLGPVMTQLGISDPDHWIMLEAEARRHGYVGGSQTGREFFNEIAAAQNMDPDTAFNALLVASGHTESAALDALASLRAVARLRTAYRLAPRPSQPELVSEFATRLPTVALHAAFIPASAYLDTISQFPPEELLREFFDEHKDQPRGGGALDFGYRVDPAVQFEWIEVSQSEVESAVPIDPVDVNARWRKNRELYPGEFFDERERVEADMRRQRAVAVMGDINTLVQAEAARAERNDEQLDLRALGREVSRRLSEREGFPVPPLVYDGRDERWYTLTDVQATPRVRNARPIAADYDAPFPRVALNVAELNPENPYDVRVGEVIGPLRSAAGSTIYARVIGVRPAGPPETLENVRDQVVEDYRLQQAWDTLTRRAERFPQQIAARGLPTVVSTEGGEIVAGLRATPERLEPPVTREIDQQVFNQLNEPAFAGAVHDQAQSIEPIGDVTALPIDQRIVLTELEDKAAIAIGVIIAVDPISQTNFRLAAEATLFELQSQRINQMMANDPFSFDAMKRRLSYELIGEREDRFDDELEAAEEDLADAG